MCKYPPLADSLVLAIVLPPKQQSIWSVSGTCNTPHTHTPITLPYVSITGMSGIVCGCAQL